MATLKPARLVQTKYGSWSIHYTNLAGRRRRLTAGNNLTNAKEMVIQFNEWLSSNNDPEEELAHQRRRAEIRNITLSEFFPVFYERHGSRQSKSMQQLYKTFFKNISRCKEITSAPMSKLSRGVLYDYMHLRIKNDGVTTATVNREAAFVKGMLSRAVDWEIIPENPLSKLRLLKEAEKRQVNLTPEQALELINALHEPVASMVEFAIYSGFRRENILSLRIEQLRLNDIGNIATVELTVKGGKTELYPLGPQAVSVLSRMIGNRTEGYVFTNRKTNTRYTTFHKQFDKAVRKLGIKVGESKLRFHDLRHVFATWLHRSGVSIDVIRPLLGHSKVSTTERYTTYNRIECGSVLRLLPDIRSVDNAII